MNKVSIVVSTYNEEKNIAKLLESCVNQTYENKEIIVVDSERTSDKTLEISKKYTDKVFKFGKERSPQRNHGVEKATGEFVLTLDADMTLDREVVEECVKVIQSSSDMGAVVIPEKSYGENFWAKARALERNCYIGDETIEAARFFPREVYLNAGGFNPRMISGEDWDLTQRIRKMGLKVGRINHYIHHNEGSLNPIKSIKKKYYYSKMADEYITSNVKSFKDIILYLVRPAYFRNWKMLVAHPILTMGFLFMKYSEFFVGGFFAIALKKSFWKRIFGVTNKNQD